MYDLTIDGEHEYFANGVLVHNCTPAKGLGNQFRGPAYTVGVLMAQDLDDRFWVLDVRRARMDSFERERLIYRTAHGDGSGVIVVVEQEPGTASKESILQTAQRLRGFRVRPVAASGSKESRADDFEVCVNMGGVYLPEKVRLGNTWIDWAAAFVDELRHWPHSTYLDQVDAASMAYNFLNRKRSRAGPLRQGAAEEYVVPPPFRD